MERSAELSSEDKSQDSVEKTQAFLSEFAKEAQENLTDNSNEHDSKVWIKRTLNKHKSRPDESSGPSLIKSEEDSIPRVSEMKSEEMIVREET